ncbi:hypothetical protein E2C01_094877 [Portunus trituberculatus]|uniref:Uncharacterized protein n=1 Tax=Portunus trituberculatus TaxID=210409 RepID=A0A5B7JYD3_PORTR|nr:hypothetical protein [Portunus trituberculatus]
MQVMVVVAAVVIAQISSARSLGRGYQRASQTLSASGQHVLALYPSQGAWLRVGASGARCTDAEG